MTEEILSKVCPICNNVFHLKGNAKYRWSVQIYCSILCSSKGRALNHRSKRLSNKERAELELKRADVLSCGCMIFSRSKKNKQYGQLKIDNKHYNAHRFIYEHTVGLIPDGLEVCHKCDNPGCINPEHLFIGTHLENMQDMVAKDRKKKIKRNQMPGIIKQFIEGVPEEHIAESLGINVRLLKIAISRSGIKRRSGSSKKFRDNKPKVVLSMVDKIRMIYKMYPNL